MNVLNKKKLIPGILALGMGLSVFTPLATYGMGHVTDWGLKTSSSATAKYALGYTGVSDSWASAELTKKVFSGSPVPTETRLQYVYSGSGWAQTNTYSVPTISISSYYLCDYSATDGWSSYTSY